MAGSKKIKEQRNRFLAFAFASSDLFLEISEEGTITYALGASKGLTGFEDQDVMGKKWQELFDDSDHFQIQNVYDAVRPGKRGGPLLVQLNNKLSEQKAILGAMRLPGGPKTYVTLGFSNIVMEKLAELMLEEGITSLTTGYEADNDKAPDTLTTGYVADDDKDEAPVTTGYKADDDKKDDIEKAKQSEDAKTKAVTTDFKADDDQNTQSATTGFQAEEDKASASLTTGYTAEDDKEAQSITTDYKADDDKNNDIETPTGTGDTNNGPVTTDFKADDDKAPDTLTTGYEADDDEAFDDSLYNKQEFVDEAERVFEFARTKEIEPQLTVFDFGRTEAIPEEDWAGISERIAEFMRAESIDGKIAAEIGGKKYSLIHDGSKAPNDIAESIISISKEHDPKGEGIDVTSKTIETDLKKLSSHDAARALFHTITEFEKSGTEMQVEGLEKGFDKLVTNNKDKLNELVDIIDRVDFNIRFQSIADLKTGETHHYEVLSRMRSGEIQEWVKFGEDAGLCANFDLAVVERTLNYIHFKAGTTRSIFSINISPKSIEQDDFLERLEEVLAKRDLKNRVMFEITDSAHIQNVDKAKAFINDIQNLGYKVSLDNFGGAMALPKNLKKLPVDYIKIDGKYIDKLLTSKKMEALIEGMTMICKDMGIEVIAKQIENQEQANVLKQMGVHYGQGFLFGKAESSPNYSPPQN